MTSICLIRHGETDWNKEGKIQGKTDIPLNETGRLQAEKSAVFLSRSKWDIIITSPLIRAKHTAEIINKKLHLPIIEMVDFEERNYGEAEGLTPEERKRMFPTREYPNEEKREFVIERVMRGIQSILETYPNKKVLLVAHGGVINLILATLSNGEIGTGKTKLTNACISNIYYHENSWQIKDYNQISHLSDR
ncbi:histidine phosphatase family protein [Pseudogracilibacillus sp. SE30717A]|uniref:histidine phosphatase family protein n=1 Tax=Pseudogracilibacillus sp. SE30717A TaxID=3098293 RepID=UPI00300E367B